MKERESATIAIIGGADGPTSVFTADKAAKLPLRIRLRKYLYTQKRRRAEKRITPQFHTLKETVCYAAAHYGAAEVEEERREEIEQRNSHKESLVIRYRPELIGLSKPDPADEASVRAFYSQIQQKWEKIAAIAETELSMDFHIYEIRLGESMLQMAVDFTWDTFGISYSGNKPAVKRLKKIVRELYLYYGVTEKDIQEKTERYYALLGVLSA